MRKRPLSVAAGSIVFILLSSSLHAEVMAIQGTWRLDEKASTNVSDQMKGIDLRFELKGNKLSVQRLFEDAPVGDPLVVTLDGVPVTREIAKGQPGTIAAQWKAGGRILSQTVTTKVANLIEVTQTTVTTVTDDGQIMTRVQTQKGGGTTTERVLIYRRKK